MQSIYERKTALETALSKTKTEADVLLGCITEYGTIIVSPYWECNTSPEDLLKELAALVVGVADEASEGTVIGSVCDKRKSD